MNEPIRMTEAAPAPRTNRFEPVRGYISSYGGKLAVVHVDDDVTQYPDGRVVVVPEELWDEMSIQLADTLDRAEPQAPRPLIVRCKPGCTVVDVARDVRDLWSMATIEGFTESAGVLIIPAELESPT